MAGDMTLKDSTTESRTIALEIFSHFSVEDRSLNLFEKGIPLSKFTGQIAPEASKTYAALTD